MPYKKRKGPKIIIPSIKQMRRRLFIFWRKRIQRPILQLFNKIMEAIYGDRKNYFPLSYRRIILEAGLDHKLLRVTYDRVPRVVEPYAIIYKQRKDGVRKEYLYVFDRTGGRTATPGLKSLVSEKIQHIEKLAQRFTPRYSRTYFLG